MAIRFSGKVSDAVLSALVAVIVQEGWDYAKEWLKSQGVQAENVAFDPNQQLDAPFTIMVERNKFYYHYYIDRKNNIYLCHLWKPFHDGTQWQPYWEQVAFKAY